MRVWVVVFLLLAGPVLGQEDLEEETGFVEMPAPEDGSYYLTSGVGSNRHWGRPETIRALLLVAKEWHRLHPDITLGVGDISKRDGSRFPPHKTHKNGTHVDIVTRGRGNACHITWEDQAITLELARLFRRFGARQILYNHPDVYETLDYVTKWPKHDDHFHVTFDPKEVPTDDGPWVVPEADLLSGTFIGPDRVKADRTGLLFGWRFLAPQPGWQQSFQLVIQSDGKTWHDTGIQKSNRPAWRLDEALEDGRTYRWKVTVTGPEDRSVDTGWQEFRTDFSPPTVTAEAPAPNAELDANPVLKWTYADGSGEKQAAFRVEIDKDKRHRRRARLDLQRSSRTSWRLPFKLKAGRTYYWRVVVHDGHGNEAASEWRPFETTRDYRWTPPTGTVTAESLNFRKGPGTQHGKLGALKKGTEVIVLKTKGDWLFVQAVLDGKRKRGWVHGNYVKR